MSFNFRLPNITAKNEREQLLQIRSYLYQLAQDLQWAFNDAGRNRVSLPESTTKGAENLNSNCADYVVKVGTNSGWTYRKWKGGTYEMFGNFEVTPLVSTLNGSLYMTNDMSISVPFTITSAFVSGTVNGLYWITNAGISGTSAITLRIMSDKPITTTNAIEVRLHVVGTYS